MHNNIHVLRKRRSDHILIYIHELNTEFAYFKLETHMNLGIGSLFIIETNK